MNVTGYDSRIVSLERMVLFSGSKKCSGWIEESHEETTGIRKEHFPVILDALLTQNAYSVQQTYIVNTERQNEVVRCT